VSVPPRAPEPEERKRLALSPFAPAPRSHTLARTVAIAVTLGLHAAAAIALAMNPGLAKKATSWVEMTVAEVAEPPPAEEPPKPEPPKEPPKRKKAPPKEVALERTAEETQPDAPPDAPPEAKPLKRIQGLSANSFAPGAGTALAVRAGNTTATAADGRSLSLDEASTFTTLPASAVATPPKLSWEPGTMEVPQEAQDARVQGTVEVRFDVDGEGRPIKVQILRDLGYGTGEACRAAWSRSRWKPGLHEGQPVTVTGIRKFCTVRIQG
jgi:protein TonB